MAQFNRYSCKIANRLLAIQYNATPAGTNQPRYRDKPTENAIIPYLFNLDCSAWITLAAFCATHNNQADTPAAMGTIISMPPTSDGTQLRLIPQKSRDMVSTCCNTEAISTPARLLCNAANCSAYLPLLIISTTVS